MIIVDYQEFASRRGGGVSFENLRVDTFSVHVERICLRTRSIVCTKKKSHSFTYYPTRKARLKFLPRPTDSSGQERHSDYRHKCQAR